jgi:Nucleotidyl transferase AbiEii toxin, Type IV TA system
VTHDQAGYGSPGAFRRALTDRLRTIAAGSRWALPHLQRQFAYDRLLERLYTIDDGWIVKGAAALLARDLGMRATIDVDVYRERAREVAEAELREAAGRDIGDWFRFETGAGRPVGDGDAGVRLPTTAYVGPTEWGRFHVDLVGSDLRMTGEPEPTPPLTRVAMPDVEQHGYRVYPLVDHIADKVVATFPPDSTSPTARCGSADMRPRLDGRCCPSGEPSPRHLPSSAPASIPCSTGLRPEDGIRSRDDGGHEFLCGGSRKPAGGPGQHGREGQH